MLELWYMFPTALVVATIAMLAGIGGAILFAPVLLIVVGVDAITAIFTGIAIEVFGFGSGLVGYWRARSINIHIALRMIPFAVVGVIIGVTIGHLAPDLLLKIILCVMLIILAYRFLRSDRSCTPKHPDVTGKSHKTSRRNVPSSILWTSGLGGILLGVISSGLGEINEYNLLHRLGLPLAVASGTSVFVVSVAAFVGVIGHILTLIQQQSSTVLESSFPILIFSIPGVLIGAQFGVKIAQSMPDSFPTERLIGVLFIVLALLVPFT